MAVRPASRPPAPLVRRTLLPPTVWVGQATARPTPTESDKPCRESAIPPPRAGFLCGYPVHRHREQAFLVGTPLTVAESSKSWPETGPRTPRAGYFVESSTSWLGIYCSREETLLSMKWGAFEARKPCSRRTRAASRPGNPALGDLRPVVSYADGTRSESVADPDRFDPDCCRFRPLNTPKSARHAVKIGNSPVRIGNSPPRRSSRLLATGSGSSRRAG